MSARLTSEFWVTAHVRRCHLEGAFAVVRRRGAREAGAIFLIVDRLDGSNDLYAPAPQSEASDASSRTFERVAAGVDGLTIEERVGRELRFDPDAWVVAIEDRQGRAFLD